MKFVECNLEECFFDVSNEQKLEEKYKSNITSDELLKFSSEYIEAYYKVILAELDNLEYLPIDMKIVDSLFDNIDSYNYKYNLKSKDSCLTIDKLNSNQKIKNDFMKFCLEYDGDFNTLKQYDDILNLLGRKIALTKKIDKLVIEHAKDEICGFIPHICMYKDNINNFIKGTNSSFDDFKTFIDTNIISYKIIILLIDRILNIKLYSKKEVIDFLNKINSETIQDDRYGLLMCEFIKIHRKSNLKKKEMHISRVTMLTIDSIKNKNIPDLFKSVIVMCAMYHDIGRFYHGAFYDGYVETPMTECEEMYGDGDLIKGFDHAKIGYYVSMNSLIDFNAIGLEKSQKVNDLFEIVAPIISSIINIHGKSNSDYQCFDDVDSLKNISLDLSSSECETVLLEGVKCIYELCRIMGYEKETHLPVYDTILSESDFYESLLEKKDLYSKIIEFLSTSPIDYEIVSKIHDVVVAQRVEYDFSKMLIEWLEGKVKKDLPKEQEDRQNECLNKISSVFKSFICYSTLMVMDMDKVDIFVQLANGWLDNNLVKKAVNVKIPVNHPLIENETIDLNKFFGFNLTEKQCNIINNGSNIVEFKDGKSILKLNYISKSKNQQLYLLDVPNQLFNVVMQNTESNAVLTNRDIMMKRVALPDDVIMHYLCLDENNSVSAYRGNNVLQILYWRIYEFFINNMRLTSSFEQINNIKVMKHLLVKLYNVDPSIAKLLKPILYVLHLYIKEVKSLNCDIITLKDSKAIRENIKSKLLSIMGVEKVEDIDTDKLFVTLIGLYDGKKRVRAQGDNPRGLF